MTEVDLLVLASSRKPGGRCLAGYDLEGERWIRPISELSGGTMTLAHCAVDGRWPEVLDVVRIELTESQPQPWQPENWRLGDQAWELIEQIEPDQAGDILVGLVDHDVRLLHSTERKVAAGALRQNPIDASLTLVRPDSLQWRIEQPPWGRQQKAYFTVDGAGHYDFQVTDLPIEAALEGLGLGVHDRDAVGIDDHADVYLTLSLAEPYERNDDCYKLAAAVIRAVGGKRLYLVDRRGLRARPRRSPPAAPRDSVQAGQSVSNG